MAVKAISTKSYKLSGTISKNSNSGCWWNGKNESCKSYSLHHPDIAAKYEHRFFAAADSALTSSDLVALVGSHIGLKPAKDLKQPIVQFFASRSLSLLILDNLETPWE
ncbi:hypothetical protein FB451DRAFT_1173416 [Mycena latifolia]|nr:hypothetical protein FB451DRAFT_1173416 [Mycena latifolia]